MAATTLAATSSIPISELRSGSSERILVVEHDGALRKILGRLFSSEGYAFSPANRKLANIGLPIAFSAHNLELPCAGVCQTIVNCLHFGEFGN
jgi:hypothetical protein